MKRLSKCSLKQKGLINKKMKILLYGEGKKDYGIKDYEKFSGEKSVYSEKEWKPGPIVYILKNCADLYGKEISI